MNHSRGAKTKISYPRLMHRILFKKISKSLNHEQANGALIDILSDYSELQTKELSHFIWIDAYTSIIHSIAALYD